MSQQKHIITCAAMLLGGVMMAGTSSAQSLTPPYQSYSAKFSCGPQAADQYFLCSWQCRGEPSGEMIVLTECDHVILIYKSQAKLRAGLLLYGTARVFMRRLAFIKIRGRSSSCRSPILRIGIML
jgi:hypothetical protein